MNKFARILVPTDMSDSAEAALRYALFLNKTLGSRLTLLYAERMLLYPERPVGFYFESAADARRDAAERLRDYAREKTPRAAHVETTVIDDSPANAIPETADRLGADLIVMGVKHGALIQHVRRTTARPVVSIAR